MAQARASSSPPPTAGARRLKRLAIPQRNAPAAGRLGARNTTHPTVASRKVRATHASSRGARHGPRPSSAASAAPRGRRERRTRRALYSPQATNVQPAPCHRPQRRKTAMVLNAALAAGTRLPPMGMYT